MVCYVTATFKKTITLWSIVETLKTLFSKFQIQISHVEIGFFKCLINSSFHFL